MMIPKDTEVDMLWEKVQSEKRRAQERQYLEARERRRSNKNVKEIRGTAGKPGEFMAAKRGAGK